MFRHMYGLKKEIDLSFLTGRELIQVAIGSFQVEFHFDEDVTVSVVRTPRSGLIVTTPRNKKARARVVLFGCGFTMI
jgi:hypothetical protein